VNVESAADPNHETSPNRRGPHGLGVPLAPKSPLRRAPRRAAASALRPRATPLLSVSYNTSVPLYADRRRPADALGMPVRRADEIAIGAFARRQRWRRAGLAALGVLLIALAVAVYTALAPTGSDTGQAYRAKAQCTICRHTATVSLGRNEWFPIRCSKCGQRTMLQLWTCRSCSAMFPAQTGPDVVRCPVCRSTSVGSAAGP
jgi:hypothetical protein